MRIISNCIAFSLLASAVAKPEEASIPAALNSDQHHLESRRQPLKTMGVPSLEELRSKKHIDADEYNEYVESRLKHFDAVAEKRANGGATEMSEAEIRRRQEMMKKPSVVDPDTLSFDAEIKQRLDELSVDSLKLSNEDYKRSRDSVTARRQSAPANRDAAVEGEDPRAAHRRLETEDGFDIDEYKKKKIEEIERRRKDRGRSSEDIREKLRQHGRDIPDGALDGINIEDRIHRHAHSRDGSGRDHDHDMKKKHSDMLSRRSSHYKDRVESSGLSGDAKQKTHDLIDKYIKLEGDLMDFRLNSRSERLKPDGDMRDDAVKAKFKQDLRKSIDDRKERENAMRNEIESLKREVEDMLVRSSGADLR